MREPITGYEVVVNPAELEQWKVDQMIELVKDNDEEIEKLEKILNDRIDEMTRQFNNKKDKLVSQNHYMVTTLGVYAKTQKLSKAKTQSKYTSLAGNVIIKHARENPARPDENKYDDVKKRYPELVTTEQVDKLNWRDLKSKLIIQDGKVYDKETGEDVSDIVGISSTEERIEIK